MLKKVTILFIIVFITSCKTQKNAIFVEKPIEVSLISVITNPEKFHNRTIIISGYCTYEYEGTAIYLSKSDYENAFRKNAIFLYINKSVLDINKIEEPYKGYFTIEGVFNKDLKGSYNFFSGSIQTIINIRRMYKRDGINDEYNMD